MEDPHSVPRTNYTTARHCEDRKKAGARLEAGTDRPERVPSEPFGTLNAGTVHWGTVTPDLGTNTAVLQNTSMGRRTSPFSSRYGGGAHLNEVVIIANCPGRAL